MNDCKRPAVGTATAVGRRRWLESPTSGPASETDLEWIVWRVDTDGERTVEANVMGLGYRFDRKSEARIVARQAVDIARRATWNTWTVTIYLVPCPGGSMAADRSLWEVVS